jgi:hypothetical protein
VRRVLQHLPDSASSKTAATCKVSSVVVRSNVIEQVPQVS